VDPQTSPASSSTPIAPACDGFKDNSWGIAMRLVFQAFRDVFDPRVQPYIKSPLLCLSLQHQLPPLPFLITWAPNNSELSTAPYPQTETRALDPIPGPTHLTYFFFHRSGTTERTSEGQTNSRRVVSVEVEVDCDL